VSEFHESGPTATPAGWYPTQTGETRFWDGAQWTERVAPTTQPATLGHQALVHHGQPHMPSAGSYAMPMHQVMVQPKNPALAALCSFFIPGLGQFINGDTNKGVIFLVVNFFAWLLCFIIIGIFILPVVWIWSIVDAYSGAKNWNLARGIIS